MRCDESQPCLARAWWAAGRPPAGRTGNWGASGTLLATGGERGGAAP